MKSNVGLAIQCVGVLLITLLSISFSLHSALLAVLFLASFFTLMAVTISIRRELETTNKKLLQTRDKFNLLVQMDPLTEALNRHAFHSLLRSPEAGQSVVTSGSVAVIDIDNLKPINDTLGHTVGDKAIRAVARAMRSLVRADDMLFRWGGDEFLLLMFKLPQPEAARRMEKLNRILEEHSERWIGMPVSVTVSFGVAGFTSLPDLGQAIEQADKAMYARRNRVRALTEPSAVAPGKSSHHGSLVPHRPGATALGSVCDESL